MSAAANANMVRLTIPDTQSMRYFDSGQALMFSVPSIFAGLLKATAAGRVRRTGRYLTNRHGAGVREVRSACQHNVNAQ